jgi:hypothetical protein
MLNKDQILKSREREIVSVGVPEWGGDIGIAAPTLGELEKFETLQGKMARAGNGLVGFRARVAILVCVNLDGSKMFTASDEAELCKQPAKALIRIHDAAAPLLGWTTESIEDRAKNLHATTEGDSTTD